MRKFKLNNLPAILLLLFLIQVFPADAQQPEAPRIKPVPAPVTLDGQNLYTIYCNLGPYSPERRAASAVSRLNNLLKDPTFNPDSIHTIDSDVGTDILAGDRLLATITEADATFVGKSRQTLAQDYSIKMKDSLRKAIKARTPSNRALAILYTFLATIGLWLSLSILWFISQGLIKKAQTARGKYIKTLKIQHAQIMSEDTLVDILAGLTRVFQIWAAFTLIFFFTLVVVGFYPETKPYQAPLLDLALQPFQQAGQAIVQYIPNVFFIVIISILTYCIIKITHFFFNEIGRETITWPGFESEWAEPTFKIIRFLIIAFAIMLIFPYLPGSGSPAFQQISIFLGVLVSLGSTSAVSHIVAGIFLTYTRGFKIGDRVRIADTEGDVIEKTLLATRIRTIKNVEITIPNGLVLGSHIINYSASANDKGLILNSSVTIGYDVPWRKVHELLIGAAKTTEHILPEPPPFVLQKALNDFYVEYEINAYTSEAHMMSRIYSSLHGNIQDRFFEAGIEIMSPQYSSLRDGNKTTIPAQFLPGEYKAPVFHVARTE